MAKTVRVGIIGAGGFTRARVVPNFVALPNVQVTAVANRSQASAEAVAQQYGIPVATGDWREVVARDDVDAIVIGSPPYSHRDIAIAAFYAGKDVLCQTRMARTLEEARDMAQAARETGRRAMMIPPSPYHTTQRQIRHLLQSGYVGRVLHVEAHNLAAEQAEGDHLGKRADPAQYGHNNYMGLYYDVMRPWFGDATRVLSDGRIFTSERLRPDGTKVTVEIPEAGMAVAETASGAVVTLTHSDVALFSEQRIEIYGDEGTLIARLGKDTLGARKGEKELATLPIPAGLENPWRVEEEFVQLVRGESEVAVPSFDDGLKNIEYLEACRISMAEGRWVQLPLP